MATDTDTDVVFLPDSFYRQRGINPADVAPSWMRSRSTILDGYNSVNDLTQVWGGRAATGRELTVVSRGDGSMPILLVHDDKTEAAEVEDLAHEAMERKPIDFAASRERNGKNSAADFDATLRQACEDFVKRAKANPVTVRRRDPMKQFVKGLVTIPALAWKE